MYLVIYIGCIECGEETAAYGLYDTRQEAEGRVKELAEEDEYVTEETFEVVELHAGVDEKVIIYEAL